VILEVDDLSLAESFYGQAFALGARLGLRASDAPTTGFRGYTLSLVVSQPTNVDALLGAALDGGATPVKPTKKTFWGYGGVVQAPDGAIWKVATSSKKNIGPATREVDEVVVLLGCDDVAASKSFYVKHGLKVAKSFGGRYVQFESDPVTLALYRHSALAKDAGVPAEGSGSHRIALRGNDTRFTDPDGFAWEAA
jgi:predicted lactoylglutathione lyase